HDAHAGLHEQHVSPDAHRLLVVAPFDLICEDLRVVAVDANLAGETVLEGLLLAGLGIADGRARPGIVPVPRAVLAVAEWARPFRVRAGGQQHDEGEQQDWNGSNHQASRSRRRWRHRVYQRLARTSPAR